MNNEEMFRSFRQFQLAFAAIKIGLFHQFDQAPQTCSDVSQALGLPAERVIRLLRGLVWANLLSTDDQGKYALTDGGRTLLDKSATGDANGIRFQGEFFYRAWAGLSEFIATGVTPFVNEHGCDVFELLQRDPTLAELYAAPMAQRSAEYSKHLVQHPAIAAARSTVDVGGGHGRLLVDLLTAIRAATGIIFDLEVMRQRAQETMERHGGDRSMSFRGGGHVSQGAGRRGCLHLKMAAARLGRPTGTHDPQSMRSGDASQFKAADRRAPHAGASDGGGAKWAGHGRS